MKGKSASASQRTFWAALCSRVGCVACRQENVFNDYCVPHHVDGRTKPNAHWLVIPLCANHHQDNGTAIAVHPWKTKFEARYGKQRDLLVWAIEILQAQGQVVPDAALMAAGMLEAA